MEITVVDDSSTDGTQPCARGHNRFPATHDSKMMHPRVSVVIPTHNSERTIDRCLKSVRDQKYHNVEIVVVDRFSSDETVEVARQFGAKVISYNGIRSKSRNMGAMSTTGEFLLSIDSDMELTTHVLSECITKSTHFDALILPEISVGEGYWAKCRILEKSCYIGDDFLEAARFFRRDVFQHVGGYDDQLEAGEDWDIHIRIGRAGYSIGRIEAVVRHVEGRLNLHEAILKKYMYGKTLNSYLRKHSYYARRQISALRFIDRRKWRVLVRDPLHLVGLIFMKMCEWFMITLGRLMMSGNHRFK